MKSNKNSKPEGRSISNLTVFPLHEVEVGANNGWKSEGWGELHALAYDEQKAPFYLILYSNTSKGFVIDLKSPESFTTDFGGRVQFDKRDSPGTVKEKVEPESRKKVALGDILELQLDSKKEFANPYQEVQVTFTMTSPEGVTTLVPAFWDGGATWRLRFNPAKLGVWNYRTLSKIPELNGTIGSFVCIKPEFKSKGGIKIAPSFLNPRNFVSSNGDPFFPVPVQGSLADDIGGTNDLKKGRPDSFTARIDLLVSAGVNRIAGGYLLDGVGFESAFLSNGVLTSSGVKLFQKLDRRVAYCNEKGITPDFGLGLIGDKTFQQFGSEAVFRFWGYVVSRYSAYNVCWNLYERDGMPLSLQTRNYLNQLAELTRLYDSTHHPMTGVTPGYSAMAKSDAISDRAGSTPNFAPWQNYIVFRGGDVLSLSAFQSEKKPVFVFEPVSENRGDADIMRKRMWKARMSGAYWVGGDTIANTALESMAKFFAQTRFSNLEPHNEMLGGDRESAAARRRRKKAELELAKERENNSAAQPTPDKSQTRGDVTSDDSPPAAIEAPIILALATPAKEYVIYFESGGEIFLDLLEATGNVKVSWFNPRTGETSPIKKIDGGKYVGFTAPDTQDWVLHVTRR